MQALRERLAVKPEDLRRRLDPATLPFQTTAEVAPVETTIGQPRAAEAIAFALEVGARGFHLYAAGSPGTGRESTVLAAVHSFAATRPTPPDWVYVHNFAEPDRPRAFPMPAGQGRRLAKAMTWFLEAAQQEIPRAFESEDYARRREQSLAEVTTRRAKLIADLRAFAQEREFALEMTPTGTASIPLQNGQPIPPQAFEQLPPETKAELEQRSKQGQVEVGASMRQMRQIEKEAQERVTALDRGVALVAAGPLIAELHEEYGDQPDVLAFVEQIETDLPEHLHDFWPAAETGQAGQADGAAAARGPQRQERLARYQVNVLIDNSGMTGAPVVVERNPTYYNLIGRLDYRTVLGTMVTDFRQIKPGALHRANGGFLVLHALHVMPSPFAWEELKRALLSGEVRIENPGEQLSALSGLPLNQGIAATGAVNQHGEVQAVGGVTRKIEGFYDVCRERVLTGGQGVIVPTANVKNLMLKEEIVEAVRAGRFHVWAVSHIDQGIELLMERVAGERAADGTFPEGTVHRLVQDRLREYAEQLREFGNVSPGAALAAHARRNGNEDVPRERFRLRRRSACRGSR